MCHWPVCATPVLQRPRNSLARLRQLLHVSCTHLDTLVGLGKIGDVRRTADHHLRTSMASVLHPATELSGGEPQRIKLATELQRSQRGDALYVLDEPTTGLHAADVDRLMVQLERLVDAGITVIVVEHDLRVIAASDWVVDMGPGGGSAGGQVVATGTPREVSLSRTSRTATYLRRVLQEETKWDSARGTSTTSATGCRSYSLGLTRPSQTSSLYKSSRPRVPSSRPQNSKRLVAAVWSSAAEDLERRRAARARRCTHRNTPSSPGRFQGRAGSLHRGGCSRRHRCLHLSPERQPLPRSEVRIQAGMVRTTHPACRWTLEHRTPGHLGGRLQRRAK